jgi:hypothetical protein
MWRREVQGCGGVVGVGLSGLDLMEECDIVIVS